MKRLLLLAGGLGSVALFSAESRLTNVSVRSNAGTDAETLIVGFAIGGSGTKQILLRGIGPTLSQFGVTGVVSDPQLRLFRGSSSIGENDDWGGETTLRTSFSAVGAFSLASASRDAALQQALSPGSYSAHLVAASGPGVALVECYAADGAAATAYITNLSARSMTGAGASVLTIGFGITGTQPKTVLIRGIGPTLNAFGVTGALADARLRLFDAAGIQIGDNSGWTSAISPTAVFNSVGAFALPVASRDAVLLLGLPVGTYTAQVSGLTAATGTALVEVYEVGSVPVTVITLQPVSNTGLPAPADPGAGTPAASGDATPRPLTQTRPAYPFELRAASVTGEVLVDFYVKSDGTVGNAIALRATDTRFAAAAVAAVERWTFVPGRRSGRLVTTHMQVPIIFELNS